MSGPPRARGDPDVEARKLGNYGSRALAAKTNKGGVTPVSPLFDAIDAWAGAPRRADRVARDGALALVHAARAEGIARLAALKRERGLLGFDDMIRGVADALAGRPAARFAARLRRQYRVALVDEFQDTEPRQWAIFRRLFAEGAERPDEDMARTSTSASTHAADTFDDDGATSVRPRRSPRARCC
jgi:exodeoxyribonuclease V beta subunit